MEHEKKVFVYYHGDNFATRYATSTDGIRFEYGGVAVDMRAHNFNDFAYSRVFPITIPEHSIRYIMLSGGVDRESFKINPPLPGYRNYLSTSLDGHIWATSTIPITPLPPGTDQTGAACYLRWKNRNFIITMGNLSGWDAKDNSALITNIYLFEVDERLQNAKFQGILLDRGVLAPEHSRFSSPCVLVEDNKIHLFFTAGKRLNEKAGYAVSNYE